MGLTMARNTQDHLYQRRFGLSPRNRFLRVLLKIVQTGFEQRLFLIAQRIVGIQPLVTIEFCKL